MIKQIQLKQNDNITKTTASQFKDTFFIFLTSLGNSIVPKSGDEIISENEHFRITQVIPIVTGKHIFDNYAVDVIRI